MFDLLNAKEAAGILASSVALSVFLASPQAAYGSQTDDSQIGTQRQAVAANTALETNLSDSTEAPNAENMSSKAKGSVDSGGSRSTPGRLRSGTASYDGTFYGADPCNEKSRKEAGIFELS